MALHTQIINYLRSSRQELQRVVWPSKKETINQTLLVIGISLGVAAFLGITDYLFSLGLEQFIR